MSWVRLAVGLIREAATTQMGQDILNDIKSNTFGDRQETQTAPREPVEADRWRQSVQEQLKVTDRNIEMLVRMVNAQDEALVRVQKRQRIWNVVLACAFAAAAAAAAALWLWPA